VKSGRTSGFSAAIPLACIHPWIADALFVAVALIWLIPDTRIERTLSQTQHRPRRQHKKRKAAEKPDVRPDFTA